MVQKERYQPNLWQALSGAIYERGRDTLYRGGQVAGDLSSLAAKTLGCTFAIPFGEPAMRRWDEHNNISTGNFIGEWLAHLLFVGGNASFAYASYKIGGTKALVIYGTTSLATNLVSGLVKLGMCRARKKSQHQDIGEMVQGVESEPHPGKKWVDARVIE